MPLSIASLFSGSGIKLSSKLFTGGAVGHVKKHWLKYASAGFIGGEVMSNTILRDTVKADNPQLSDDDIEIIISEIEGFVEDMRSEDVLMSDAIRRGDREPRAIEIPLTGDNKGKMILKESTYGKSYVNKLKSTIKSLQRRTNVWRRYTRQRWNRK